MRALIALGFGIAALTGPAGAEAAALVKAPTAVAPVAQSPLHSVAHRSHRHADAARPYGLRFHAPYDFYPTVRYRRGYYPGTVEVYRPQRYGHPRFGYKYWYRY